MEPVHNNAVDNRVVHNSFMHNNAVQNRVVHNNAVQNNFTPKLGIPHARTHARTHTQLQRHGTLLQLSLIDLL